MADLSCDDSTSVGTPVQKGAARRDPRRGAIPVMREPHAVSAFCPGVILYHPVPGEVVSGIQAIISKSNFRRNRPAVLREHISRAVLHRRL